MPEQPASGDVTPAPADAPGGGQVRPILIHPDPALREMAQPAGYLPAGELTRLAADMLVTMYRAEGRGLAGPQISVMRRIFVMDAGWKEGRSEPLVILDPEIVARSDRCEIAQERCLSIPDRPVRVSRPHEVVLVWYDLEGRHHRKTFSGAAARIVQHEVDHLDGRLILDFE